MLKLELDWAADEEPKYGVPENGIVVEKVSDTGPSGWPSIVVYAFGDSGSVAGPALWSWLVNEYGCDDDDASELASLAEWVG